MIYFIRNADCSAIKIGTTICLSQRLQALAAEHGDLEVIAVTERSYAEEKELHRRFAQLRTIGEWFEPGDDLVAFIVAEEKPWDAMRDAPPPQSAKLPADVLESSHRRGPQE